MSNCIDLHNHVVVFSPEEMRTVELHEDLKAHDSCGKDGTSFVKIHDVADIEALCELRFWFLGDNTKLHSDNTFEIRFGEGNSSHTWRDFAWTVNTILKYMKKEKRHVFKASDESDGFTAVYDLPVVFGEEFKS